MSKLDLIINYENYLLGNEKKIEQSFFSDNKKTNRDTIIELFKYLIEDIFKWSPEDAKHLLTIKIIKEFKLYDLAEMWIDFEPGMTDKEKCIYIVHLCYPDKIKFNRQQQIIHVYEKILMEDEKYPKKFFTEKNGMMRACVCLQYVINKYYPFASVSDLYHLFSDKEKINQFLKKYKLQKACKELYNSPLDFLHYSLKKENRDDFLYHYYLFMNIYNDTKNVCFHEIKNAALIPELINE